jgi:3'-phosphoadenosine 5'-phosphosulfate sulfotransferase (PAPS reductase)/FAD synthetase
MNQLTASAAGGDRAIEAVTASGGGAAMAQLDELIRSLRAQGGNRAARSDGPTPVVSIEHAVSIDEMVQLVRRLPEQELQALFEYLPEDSTAIPQTRESLVDVIRSYQMRDAVSTLNHVLLEAPVGGLVSAELGYEYSGEGVEGFLTGARKAGKQHKHSESKPSDTNLKDEENNDDDSMHD